MKMHYIKEVATLQLHPGKCTGCGRCIEVCPHAVFTMKDRHAHIVQKDNCMECGACAQNCAFGALSVKSGVGCAIAMINGIITQGDPDKGTCDCGTEAGSCC